MEKKTEPFFKKLKRKILPLENEQKVWQISRQSRLTRTIQFDTIHSAHRGSRFIRGWNPLEENS